MTGQKYKVGDNIPTGNSYQSRPSISSPAARALKGDRVAVPVLMSTSLKEAIEIEAERQNISTSELIRRAIATLIDYDLSTEAKYKRSSVYATPEDRKRAERERARERRALYSRLIREERERVARLEKEAAIKALEESVRE